MVDRHAHGRRWFPCDRIDRLSVSPSIRSLRIVGSDLFDMFPRDFVDIT